MQLRELHLQAPFMSPGTASEDIENQRGAIDDLDIEHLLKVSLLGWRQLVVDQDEVILERLTPLLDLLQLTFPDVGAGERVFQSLADRADDLNINRLGKAGKLLQGVGRRPGRVRTFYRDEERIFGRSVGG